MTTAIRQDIIDQSIQNYINGDSIRKCCDGLDVSPRTMRKYLELAEIPRRTQAEAATLRYGITPEMRQEMVRLVLQDGLTYRASGEKCDVSFRTVMDAVIAYGSNEWIDDGGCDLPENWEF